MHCFERKYPEKLMGKTIKMVSLFVLSLAIILGAASGADAKKKKKEDS